MCMKKTNGCSGSYEHEMFKRSEHDFVNGVFRKKASVGLEELGIRPESFGSF